MQNLRELGKTGVKVSPIGLGCMGMCPGILGNAHADTAESLRTLHAAVDAGCTFWNTADMYQCGDSEKLIGQVLKDRRKDVFINTKIGVEFEGEGLTGKWTHKVRNDKDYLFKAIEASCKRLQTDHVDMVTLCRIDDVSKIEETVAALGDIVKAGKARFVGLSEASAETLRRAAAVYPIAAHEIEYSAWTTDIENNGILAAQRELGISTVAYSPLGRGFLVNRFKSYDDLPEGDFRRGQPRFMGENWNTNIRLADAIQAMAARKGCTAGQLSLAWLLHQGNDIIPIPGTSKPERMLENIKAAEVQFGDDDEAELRKIIKDFPIQGGRYAPAVMAGCTK